MKKLISLIAFVIILNSCTNSKNNSSGSDTTVTDTYSLKLDSTNTESSSKWDYSDTEDKMTSRKTYIASLVSPTDLKFDFPYENSFGILNIRKKRGETDIAIRVSSGQFKTGYDGTTIKARFDKDKAQTYSVSEASDGSSDVLFIDNVSKFLKNLRTHKKLIIEAEFYSEGNRQIDFNIDGLVWKH